MPCAMNIPTLRSRHTDPLSAAYTKICLKVDSSSSPTGLLSIAQNTSWIKKIFFWDWRSTTHTSHFCNCYGTWSVYSFHNHFFCFPIFWENWEVSFSFMDQAFMFLKSMKICHPSMQDFHMLRLNFPTKSLTIYYVKCHLHKLTFVFRNSLNN